MPRDELLLALGLSKSSAQILTQIVKSANQTAKYVSPFQSAEILRKRGLVNRYTTYVTGADWADSNGVTEQYRNKTPKPEHEWWLTQAGEKLYNFMKENS